MDEAILSQSWRGIQEKGLIVVCNRDDLRRKVKILNANNDNFLLSGRQWLPELDFSKCLGRD